MIYIPEGDDVKGRVEKSVNKKGDVIYYWWITDKINILIRSNPNDIFYTELIHIGDEIVLPCPEAACQCLPQLRYNKIINKWFCNCPSSALCTKNDDQDELDKMFSGRKNIFNKEYGFYDNPVEAICNWNIMVSKSQIEANQELLKHILKNESSIA